jgi:energy-converting hydrogenase B subunit I
MSPILKIFAFPAAIVLVCLGILTILGGHITPGGGFQGGAMIASAVVLCIVIYGVEKTPFNLSHSLISAVESIGALGYILLGLAGLLFTGFFLYNTGADFYNLVPGFISNIFHYPDVTNGGIVPYLNIFVGLKVFVGLSAIVIAFSQFKTLKEEKSAKNLTKNLTKNNNISTGVSAGLTSKDLGDNDD